LDETSHIAVYISEDEKAQQVSKDKKRILSHSITSL